MYRKVGSNIVLKSELSNVLQSTVQTHNALARNIPGRDMQIYSDGFLAAIQAVAMAYDLQIATSAPAGNCGELRITAK